MQTAAKPASQYSDIPPQNLTGYEPKTRDDLLMLATTRFCAVEHHTRLSSEQYKEAFYLLVGEVTSDTKRRLATLLAECAYTPRPIALYFAMEELEIAAPMLATSRVLGQLDLLQIVDAKNEDHATVVATRPDLGPSMIRRLQRVGSARVNSELEQNYAILDHSLKRDAEALFSMIDTRKEAEDSDRVQETLPDEIKDHSDDSQPIATDPVVRTNAESTLLSAAARGGRIENNQLDNTKAEPSPVDLGKAMEKAAQAKSHQAMAVLMQKHGNISLAAAFQVLEDKNGDTLAVFMRAHDIEEAQASRIQLLAFPNIGLSVQNAMRAVRFYHKLDVENCRTAILQWPKPKDQERSVHQPYVEEGKPVRSNAVTAVKAVEWSSGKQRQAG